MKFNQPVIHSHQNYFNSIESTTIQEVKFLMMIVSNQSFSHVRVFRIGISDHIVSHVWRNHLSMRLRQYTKLRLIKVGLYLADDPHIGNYWVPVWWRSLDFFFNLGLIQV